MQQDARRTKRSAGTEQTLIATVDLDTPPREPSMDAIPFAVRRMRAKNNT
jgi:hypothetical protein